MRGLREVVRYFQSPGSCKTCTCRHVFEGMKQIEGKRFSGLLRLFFKRHNGKMEQ